MFKRKKSTKKHDTCICLFVITHSHLLYPVVFYGSAYKTELLGVGFFSAYEFPRAIIVFTLFLNIVKLYPCNMFIVISEIENIFNS